MAEERRTGSIQKGELGDDPGGWTASLKTWTVGLSARITDWKGASGEKLWRRQTTYCGRLH